MKKFFNIVAGIVVVLTSLLPAAPALADTNLIANPAVATATNNKPNNWTGSSWGTNTTTLSYLTNSGHGDSTSLQVSMTNRTDGDAKWAADPANVTAGQSYTYSDWYISGVATELDAQYTTASGTVSYAYLGSVPASASWNQATATFVIPANITKAVILHILYSNGTLQTDDFSLATTVVAPPPADGNLILNPSFATANAGLPANWSTNTWGTNTTQFTYNKTSGHTDTTSATVAITSFASGDAKWYADPVAVTAGKQYVYSDWYKSGVVTHAVAAFTTAAGVTSYAALPDAAAASAWTRYGAAVVIPTGIAKVSVYHLLSAVGSLTIDDASLIPDTTTTTTPPTGYIANDSLEQASLVDPTTPASWTKSSWGTNTATFQYVTNDGHTGTKSLKTTVSNYVDGDAKWFFNPITTLQKGSWYRWTTWYKTNTTARAVVMFLRADGSEEFFGMPNPFPASNSDKVWTKYSETFLVPQDAVSTSVFLFISQNGWVQVDDQSITSYQPIGWNQPLVTLTFDDGYEENVTNALPVLNQYGFKTTQCFETADLQTDPAAGKANVLAFFNTGHEICSHTVTHPMLTTLTTKQVDTELSSAKTYLEKLIGKSVPNFASPYGDYNASVNTEIKKYYSSHRTVDEGFNSKDNFDAYRLRVQNMTPTTTLAQYQAWLDQAKKDKTWLILVYHRITNDAPEAFDTEIDPFKQQMAALKASGISVMTMQQALTTVKAQL